MTIEEASKKYCIPVEVLKEYESWGLCSEVKKVMGTWHCDSTDLERLSMIMALHDVGLDNADIEEYMRLMLSAADTSAERLAILNKRRCCTLDEIHFREHQLERLDYLRGKMCCKRCCTGNLKTDNDKNGELK